MLYGNGTTRLETYSRSVGDSETDTWKFLRTKAKNCNTSVFEAGYYFLVDDLVHRLRAITQIQHLKING